MPTDPLDVPYANYQLESANTLIDSLAATRDSVAGAATDLEGHWVALPAHIGGSGVEASRFYTAANPTVQDLRDLADDLDHARTVLVDYVESATSPLAHLRVLATEVQSLATSMPREVPVWMRSTMSLEDRWAYEAGLAPGTGLLFESPWVDWNRERDRLEGEIAKYKSQYEAASQECVSQLQRMSYAALSFHEREAMGRAWAAQAQARIDEDRREVEEAVAAAKNVANNPGDTDAVLAWRTELGDLSGSPTRWQLFFSADHGVEGADLAMALDGLEALWLQGNPPTDRADVVAAGEIVREVRDNLAMQSHTWDESRARDFAESLLTPVEDGDVSATTVALLFADHEGALMAPALVTATANVVDRWERGNGGRTATQDSVIRERGARTLLVLASREDTSDPDVLGDLWKPQNLDLPSQVFDSLALHPAASLEWLSSPELYDWSVYSHQPTRIEFWFGERDWGHYGLETVLDVAVSGLEVPGGLTDTVGAYDAMVWQDQSDVSAEIIRVLARNESFVEGATSTAATQGAATIMGSAFASLMEGGVQGSPQDDEMNRIVLQDGTLGIRPVMQVEQAELQLFSKPIARDPEAGAVLDQHIGTYVNSVRQGLALPAPSDESSINHADLVERMGRAQGVSHGVGSGGALQQAVAQDERTEAIMEAVDFALGAVPGAGAVVAKPLSSAAAQVVVEISVDAAQTATTSVTVDMVKEALATHYGNELLTVTAERRSTGRTLGDEAVAYLELLARDGRLVDSAGNPYRMDSEGLDTTISRFEVGYRELSVAFGPQSLADTDLAAEITAIDAERQGSGG